MKTLNVNINNVVLATNWKLKTKIHLGAEMTETEIKKIDADRNINNNKITKVPNITKT